MTGTLWAPLGDQLTRLYATDAGISDLIVALTLAGENGGPRQIPPTVTDK